MKPKYIVEITKIDLIPCKTKREVNFYLDTLQDDDNVSIMSQEQFKEAYGEYYEK